MLQCAHRCGAVCHGRNLSAQREATEWQARQAAPHTNGSLVDESDVYQPDLPGLPMVLALESLGGLLYRDPNPTTWVHHYLGPYTRCAGLAPYTISVEEVFYDYHYFWYWFKK